MLLTIHDANLKKVAFIDNEKQDTLNYFDDVWTRNLETGSSTFEFTVFKKSIDKAYSYLNEKAFVSFKYNGKSYVFNVMTVEENEQTITCYCENLNLELINEYANSYKASKAMSFVEYCNAMDLLSFTYLSIGINEISDQKRTLEWEGQDTKLARLLSLATKFDAEIDFDTQLNADSTIKSFKVNVYHENDGTHQGVGRIRNDIRLTYGKNLKSITRKIDKTNVVNAIRSTGTKDGKTVVISGLSAWEEKNADGIVEFYQKGEMLYAPISMQMYPSAFTSDTTKDQWIRKDITVDSDDPAVIRSAGIRELKKNAYPAITYDVDGFVNVEIGDTVKIHDDGFNPVLIVEARVSDQKISFTNPQSNKTTFANFKALENQLSDGIQERLDELVEQAKPYTIKLSTDNGVVFKNNIGQSIVIPTLYKGSKPVVTNVTWRWALDGSVTTGMTYTVRGANVTDTATLTVSAYISNDEVAVDEISFVNVLDGVAGKDGKGITNTVITYGISASETTQPTNWTASVPTLVKGQYLWTKTVWTYTDNTKETGYTKTYIAKDGNNGADGIAGKDGVGITSTTITYASSSSGTTAPSSGWTSAVPSVPPGEFLWTKTVWTYTDNTTEAGYNVGKIGVDGRTSYFHTAYANSADGRTDFSTTDSSKRRYIGTYTDYTQAGSTDPTKYEWVDMVGTVNVGYDNYIVKSNKQWTNNNWPGAGITPTVIDGRLHVETVTGNNNFLDFSWEGRSSPNFAYIEEQFNENDDFTITFWCKRIGGSGNPAIYIKPGMGYYSLLGELNSAEFKPISYTGKWKKANNIAFHLGFVNAIGTFEFEKFKISKGNIITDWTASSKDIQAQIDTKADQAKVVYKTDISVTDEGIVHSASKTVNGQTIASMIAQRAEWVEIIANLLKVKGDMIVDGTIGTNKLSVSTLAALAADLGQISGGSLELLKSEAQGTSVDAWGSFTIPAHKWGLYIDSVGAISSGTPVRKSSSESTASDMPVAVLSSGELRFARVDQNNDLGSVLHYGLSDPDNASINFDVASDGTRKLLIRANGQIVNQATNYTGWNSTGVSGVYYKRQGDVVALRMQVTTTANQAYGLGKIPVSLLPIQNAGTMMRVTAWTVDQSIGRNLQFSNSDGSMVLLSSSRGDAFNTQVTWII